MDIGNRIGNMDAVDNVNGVDHLILEFRNMGMWPAADLADLALGYFDWFKRWNDHAADPHNVAAPRRVMEVSAGVQPSNPVSFAPGGQGCNIKLTNTCQAGMTWNGLLAEILTAENTRINGAHACFIDHSATVKKHRVLRRKARKAKVHFHSEDHAQCHTIPVPGREISHKHGKVTAEEALANYQEYETALKAAKKTMTLTSGQQAMLDWIKHIVAAKKK
jgi:hypothetical protein